MKRKTTNGLAIIHNRYYKNKPERLASLVQERANARIARDLYNLRRKNGLTQKQLATLVGTTASVISRLENADYSGHSLTMIQRIAAVLNRRIEIKFVQAGKYREAATGSYITKR
jgi:DNA-binding XRE family transcriptional regulator